MMDRSDAAHLQPPLKLDIPKHFDLGAGELVEIKYLQKTFGITRRSAMKYLKALHINPMFFGDEVFFSLPTFQRIMYVLSKPGAPGFILPGSKRKGDKRLRDSEDFLIEVTDEIIEQAADPAILAEMAAASGKNPAIIKQLAAKPIGRLRKEEK